MQTGDAEHLVLEFIDCINQGDADALAGMMAEGFTFIGYDIGDVTEGRDAMHRGFAEYFADFPNYRIHVRTVTRSGHDIAVVGNTTGSHVAPELEAQETIVWMARVGDGRVAEWRIFTDLDHLEG